MLKLSPGFSQAHPIPETDETIIETAMRAAFMRALERRVARQDGSQITLPTGPANACEIARVLRAIGFCNSQKTGNGRAGSKRPY